jgi:hypothetical protein
MATAFSRTLAQCVVDSTNAHGVRSSRRTDLIHQCIRQYIETRNPHVRCEVEYKLATRLGGFDVDIAAFSRDSGKLVACVLFKGLTSSIAKNSKNYEHNKIGEAVKAKSGMGDAKLVYIDVVPVRCPTYCGDRSIKAWETHAPADVRARAAVVTEVANAGRIAPIIDDVYTMSVDYGYAADCSISLTSIVDASDIDRFDTFIGGLEPVAAPLL